MLSILPTAGAFRAVIWLDGQWRPIEGRCDFETLDEAAAAAEALRQREAVTVAVFSVSGRRAWYNGAPQPSFIRGVLNVTTIADIAGGRPPRRGAYKRR